MRHNSSTRRSINIKQLIEYQQGNKDEKLVSLILYPFTSEISLQRHQTLLLVRLHYTNSFSVNKPKKEGQFFENY